MDRTATRIVAPVPPRSENRNGVAVAAVIVSLNPPPGFAERVAAVRAQVVRLYIVDNGSAAETRVLLNDLARLPEVQVLELPDNRGLAAALNIGVALARRDGFALALLLDHDSTPAPDMVARLRAARAQTLHPRKVLALAPEIDFGGSGIRFGWYPRARARHLQLKLAMPEMLSGPVSILNAIGSGLLVDVALYASIGGMREELFVDQVDTEFCLRGCSLGLDLVGVPGARLHHQLGHIQKHKLLGRKDVWPTHHSPLRHYYIARNRIHVARRYGLQYPGWLMFELRLALINTLNMLLYEHDRRRKLWMMLSGMLAGVLGRTGPWK